MYACLNDITVIIYQVQIQAVGNELIILIWSKLIIIVTVNMERMLVRVGVKSH